MNRFTDMSALLVQLFKPSPKKPSFLRLLYRDSQQGSRRNAMIACTELAQRRAEREDVEELFASLAAPAEAVYKLSP